MRTSERCGNIMLVIAKIQHAIDPVVKNKEVKVEGEKAKWSSSYATLGTLAKALTPHLKEHGVAKIQDVCVVTGLGPVLVTRLAIGDEWIEADYPIKETRPGSQGFGGGIGFAKRWAICGIFDIVPDDVEEGQGYKDVRAANRAPSKSAAPIGIAMVLEKLRTADSLDAFVTEACRARATHPTGEGAQAVERTIASWFVAAFDHPQLTLDDFTELRDAVAKLKPHGAESRMAQQRAGARLEPR